MDEPTTTTITFSRPVYELLKERARNEDRSVGSIVRLAVQEYLFRDVREPVEAQKPPAKSGAKAGK